mgnify:CR=1 FL=1
MKLKQVNKAALGIAGLLVIAQGTTAQVGFAESAPIKVHVTDQSGNPLAGLDVSLSNLSANLTFNTDSAGTASFSGISGDAYLSVGMKSCTDGKTAATASSEKVALGSGGKTLEVAFPTVSNAFKISLIGANNAPIYRPHNAYLVAAGRVPGLEIFSSTLGPTQTTEFGTLKFAVCQQLKWLDSQTLALQSFSNSPANGTLRITKHVTGGVQTVETPLASLSATTANQIPIGDYTHWTDIVVPNPAYTRGAIFTATLVQGTVNGFPYPRYIGCGSPSQLVTSKDGVNYSQVVTVQAAGPAECRVYTAGLDSDSVTVNFVDPLAKVRGKSPKLAKCSQVNAIWPGGVAKNTSVSDIGPKATYAPFFDPNYYAKIKSLDKDKDGISCER